VAEDAALLHQLLAAMASEAGAVIGSNVATLLEHGFGPTPGFHALLAETDQPLGLILYFPEYSTWRGQIGLFVQDIYLTPAARGLGLGRKLLASAIEHADWSPQFLTLRVARQNLPARAFYEALGMELRDTADQLILQGQGFDALMNR
jgi:GNAT superfamily N-acetyltransferase